MTGANRSNQMSLCEEVIRILGERATHRINFHQGRFRINQAAYSLVQSKLQRSEIGVEIDSDMPDRARYDRNGPTMYLWAGAEVGQIRGDAESKGLIVHECTHVITHFSSPRPTDEIEDEAIAFLAQTIYLLGIQGYTFRGSGERGGTFSQVSHRNRGRPNGRIFHTAQQIVMDHNLMDATSCTPLFDRDIAPLREAIRDHPDYPSRQES